MTENISQNLKDNFTEKLLEWGKSNERAMPWLGEKNPYLVWLSEIILQQTRVEQGLQYFEKFKKHYPTITDLANAGEDKVMKDWEGLGYYSRARNLHYTAKYIANELGGVFPDTYKDIIELKGVGPYTAAAISSFAFGLPHAVVDGNVYRILSRIFGIKLPIDSTPGKKYYQQLASELLDEKNPAIYNQTIMNFGSMQCKPQIPACEDCPFQSKCVAYNHELIDSLPVKEKKIKKRDRYFNFLIIEDKKGILLEKRIGKDIWKNLYQYPMIETANVVEFVDLQKEEAFEEILPSKGWELTRKSKPFKQTLTHQKIFAFFWEIRLNKELKSFPVHFIKIEPKNLSKFALPKIIDLYLQDNSLFLF